MERIGPEVATTISQHFTSLHNLIQWVDVGRNEELTQIDGIGDKVAEIFRNGITSRRKLIDQLSEIIEITDELEAATGLFDGKSFCITGSLSRPRKEIALFIKNLGGKVVGSVSSNLDILVAGEKAGSKLAKAESLGITIWNEETLYSQNEVKEKPRKTLFDYDH